MYSCCGESSEGRNSVGGKEMARRGNGFHWAVGRVRELAGERDHGAVEASSRCVADEDPSFPIAIIIPIRGRFVLPLRERPLRLFYGNEDHADKKTSLGAGERVDVECGPKGCSRNVGAALISGIEVLPPLVEDEAAHSLAGFR